MSIQFNPGRWMTAIFAALLMLSVQASAVGWEEGRHYRVLDVPAKTKDPSKIEVVEVFWYGCPHCYEFAEKHLPEWEASLPEDVDFVLSPATFPNWVKHARAYFAAEALGMVKKLHDPIFDAIIVKPNKYNKDEDYKDLFVKHGVKPEDFDAVFEATGFRKISKVDQLQAEADKRLRSYRLTGVPALIVNGKYVIGVREAGGFANMLKVTNYLVDKERQAMKK